MKRRRVGAPASFIREAIVIGSRLGYEFDRRPIGCLSELLAPLCARDRVFSVLDDGYGEAQTFCHIKSIGFAVR